MKSMTGFGLGRVETDYGVVAAELRSVNSRFLEVSTRLPGDFSQHDPAVRAEVQKSLSRGKVFVSVQFAPVPGVTQKYELNQPLLRLLEEYCALHGKAASPEVLLAVPNVVLMNQEAGDQEELRKALFTALADALKQLHAERQREGTALARALDDLRQQMLACLKVINDARGQVVGKYREKLQERLAEMLGPKGGALDPGRLEQEVALIADKADISEEVIRLAAHLDHLENLLHGRHEQVGRQLDFLVQEIGREVNTIGSKCRDLEITRQVLELKNLAESVKEQIANVE